MYSLNTSIIWAKEVVLLAFSPIFIDGMYYMLQRLIDPIHKYNQHHKDRPTDIRVHTLLGNLMVLVPLINHIFVINDYVTFWISNIINIVANLHAFLRLRGQSKKYETGSVTILIPYILAVIGLFFAFLAGYYYTLNRRFLLWFSLNAMNLFIFSPYYVYNRNLDIGKDEGVNEGLALFMLISKCSYLIVLLIFIDIMF